MEAVQYDKPQTSLESGIHSALLSWATAALCVGLKKDCFLCLLLNTGIVCDITVVSFSIAQAHNLSDPNPVL